MDSFKSARILCLLSLSQLAASNTFADEAVCGDFDASSYSPVTPIIRIEALFGREARDDGVKSCVVVIFGMKDKKGSDGRGLVATRVKAVAWSEGVSRSSRKAAERSLPKWLFSTKLYAASKERVYYVRFTF